MNVPSAATGEQLDGIGDPVLHELVTGKGFRASATDGLFGTVMPLGLTTRIFICRSCMPVDGHCADTPC